MKHIVEENWDEIWNENDTPAWDYLSQVILVLLKNEIPGGISGKKILEAGSGSGRISHRLADQARIFLLDNSFSAISFSKNIFQTDGVKLNITCASILNMPYHDRAFDIVWNAGVIEHFKYDFQDSALHEMVRVCKKGGLVITINPNAGSLLHNFGKFFIELFGRYPFGNEIPIVSLKDKVSILGCELKKEEYSAGFIVLWVGMFKRLTLLPHGGVFRLPLTVLNKAFCNLDSSFLGNALRGFDLFLSKLFGGYLIVSIFKKT